MVLSNYKNSTITQTSISTNRLWFLFRSYFLSVELGLRSLSMIPRFKLLASFSCLCSEGFIFPTSGSYTVTNSFVEAIGDGNKKFAPDSYITIIST